MAAISGYNSSSIGVLFSGMNTTTTKNAMFTSGASGTDLLGINYNDWATIKSGSYFKLLNAYYGKGNQISGSGETTSSTATSQDSTKTLAAIEDSAKSVQKSVAALQETGDKSLFKEVTKTDENGNQTTGYDTDAIYKAVKEFADNYNTLIDKVGDSDTKRILRAGTSLVSATEANTRAFEKIGISIGADNKLMIDETKFKAADMKKVQTMFVKNSYYGTEIKRQAGRVESYAKSEAAKANTYQKSGSYTYNYRTGELYNSTI